MTAEGPDEATRVEATGAAGWVGKTLDDRYRIERILGEGGMGAVFVAQQLRLDKKVALKIILPEHAGNAELASRFAREAMLTAKLEHPHIVSALDMGTLPEGGAYLVMQLAPGRTLRRVLETRSGWRLACEIGAQIADALVAAHALGVVHRDLKPENVIVEERDDGSAHARVLDFGIARATDVGKSAGGTPLTRLGTILGTPGYMPPEQGFGDTVDHRADLYSIGVIAWEIAAGRSLFGDKDLREIALAQLTEPVPMLDAEDAPPDLEALLDRLLQPNRDNRPASAVEVRDAFQRLVLLAAPLVPSTGAPDGRPTGHGAIRTTNEPMEASATASTGHALASPPSPGAALDVLGSGLPEAVGVAPSIARAPLGGSSAAGSARPPNVRRLAAVGAALLGLVVCGALGARVCAGDDAVASAGSADAAPGVLDTALAALTGGPLADVPSALRADVQTLIDGEDATSRVGAAARIDAARDRVPPFAGHLADFELARQCDDRRDAVRALRDDRDPRAIPALERIAALPRTGCSPSGRGDCHRCLRRDVDRALEELARDEHGDGHDSEDDDER